MTESPSRFLPGAALITPPSAGAAYTGHRARGSCPGIPPLRPPINATHQRTGGRAHHSWRRIIESALRLPAIDLDSTAHATRCASQLEVLYGHSRHALKVSAPPFSIVEEDQQPPVFRRHELDSKIEIGADGGAALCSVAKDEKGSDLRLRTSPVDKHMPRKLLHGRPPEAASLAMFRLFPEGHKPTSANLSSEAR